MASLLSGELALMEKARLLLNSNRATTTQLQILDIFFRLVPHNFYEIALPEWQAVSSFAFFFSLLLQYCPLLVPQMAQEQPLEPPVPDIQHLTNVYQFQISFKKIALFHLSKMNYIFFWNRPQNKIQRQK